MLYLRSRLGSLVQELRTSTFRKGAIALTAAAAMAAGGALVSFPAAAQETVLGDAQCRTARAVAIAVLEKYSGKISEPLANSFAAFNKSCDLKTKFERVPGTPDDDAFGEFRVKIIAIRTADVGKSVALAR